MGGRSSWDRTSTGKLPAETDIGFPIVVEGNQTKSGRWRPALEVFADQASRRLPGVDPVQIGVIQRYQPFKRTTLAQDHPFALLQRLSSRDKHRRMHAPLLVPAQGSFRLEIPPGCNVLGLNVAPDIVEMNPLRAGMEVAYIRVENVEPCDGLGVEPKANVFIGLQGERGSAMDQLESIETLAADLLAEIDAVL